MVQAWLLTPIVLGALVLGWGLMVERVSGARIPGALLAPVGFAAYLVGARLMTSTQPTVGLTTACVVLVAVAGYALGWRRLRTIRLDGWTLGAAAGVFVVFAAPIVLSGQATFAGYGVLGDTSVQFVLTDALMSHHADPSAFPLSAFSATVASYKGSGYPLGVHAGLGAARPLTGSDVAWIYQPYLASFMGMLALSLSGVLRRAIPDPRARAAAAFLAAQPALVYSFALQGSVKELATLWLVPLLVAVTVGLLETARPPAPRAVVPPLFVAAAAVNVVGPAASLWVAPTLLVALVLLLRRAGVSHRALGAGVATVVAGLVALSLPALGPVGDSLSSQGAVLTAQTEVGNLLAPLHITQALGVFFSEDYRVVPASADVLSRAGWTAVLSGFVVLAGIIGIVAAARRRLLTPLLYAGVSLLALVVVVRSGSPWADSKAIAIASPAALVAAALGIHDLLARREWVVGTILAVGVGAGVLGSNALAYHGTSLAPKDRLEELSTVGDRLSRKGPTLSTEFEEFAKHFARDARPVGATVSPTPGLQPRGLPNASIRFGLPTDLDSLEPADVQRFPALLVRRSPLSSRPPSNYRRTWTGTFYEIWQRDRRPRPLAHLGLGRGSVPAGVPSCGALARLSRRDRDATLVAAPPPRSATLDVSRRPRPSAWLARAEDPSLLAVNGPGVIRGSVDVTVGGVQQVWVRGSINRRVSIEVNGRPVGTVENELAQPAGWNLVGTVRLTPGTYRVRVSRPGGSLAPGNGDVNRTLGPVAIVARNRPSRLRRVPARDYRRLCDGSYDWVELQRR